MNLYSFYTKVYGYTRNYPGVPIWFLTPLRRMIRNSATKRLPVYFAKHPADMNKPVRENVIVSLTSFPARISYVYLTIESLLHQSVLPEKIILWLSKEQFVDENTVPERLRELQNKVFQIRYVEGDIRSHKKYYYSFMEFPGKTVITTDDDIVYPPLLIEQLLGVSKLFPQAIVANIAHKLTYSNGLLNSYSQWLESKPLESSDNVQIGAGGVLYPPHCLFGDCLKLELSQSLAPSVDDLWLNAMARLKGTSVVKGINKNAFLPIVIKDNQRLTSTNVYQNKNDEQLKQIRAYYSKTNYGDPYQIKETDR